VFFHGLLATRECVLVNFILNLLGGIGQQDGACGRRRAHLGFLTLQRWKESGVERSWLHVFQLLSYVTSHSEIWVLIDGSWDEALDVSFVSVDVRERIGEARDSLDWRESELTNVV
jgi:hypothetical protein